MKYTLIRNDCKNIGPLSLKNCKISDDTFPITMQLM